MKKLFLIILLLSVSCLHSQDKPFELEIESPISEFIPKFLLKISWYTPADSLVFDSGFFEQNNYKSFSLRDWYKQPGHYKLVVSVFNNYNFKLLNNHNLEIDLNRKEISVNAGTGFGDNGGKKSKHLTDLWVKRYYASTDSVILTEKRTPDFDGNIGYMIQNNSQRIIYCFCFNDCLVGKLQKLQNGGWQSVLRYGISHGRVQPDTPLNPGGALCTERSDFADYQKKLSKGLYKYTTEYTYKKIFSEQTEPDEYGVSKNVIDYYLLEKEFEITEE